MLWTPACAQEGADEEFPIPAAADLRLHRHVGSCLLDVVTDCEYVADNGSLNDHLHGAPSSYSPVAGSWEKRFEVLLGAARGIPSSGVHGHISSSNIHLDGASVTCPLNKETDDGAGGKLQLLHSDE